MNKTAIEWCDYTVNPVKGLCPVDCKDLEGKTYCYARRIYKRFHWDETIRYDHSWAVPISRLKTPSRIFVGSTMELFGPWIQDFVVDDIIKDIGRDFPLHTFIFLTKRPQELSKYNPWPENCWVGCSVDMEDSSNRLSVFSVLSLMATVEAKVKFLSFEPLLRPLCVGYRPLWWAEQFRDLGINWVIVGQQTPIRKPIPLEWVSDIGQAADKAPIPLFLKNNLNSCEISDYPALLDSTGNLRQEWPRGVSHGRE